MARKFYDLTAKGREYEKDGQKRYASVPAGKLCIEDDGRMWINLEWPGMNLMLNVWEQKPKDSAKPSGGKADLDDDIPF